MADFTDNSAVTKCSLNKAKASNISVPLVNFLIRDRRYCN